MWSTRKESLCVICDIGSATVSAGLVLFSKNALPKLLYSVLVPLAVGETPGKEKEATIAKYLNEALKQITEDGLLSIQKSGLGIKVVDSVYVFFASPWFTATTKGTVLEQKNPFVFDQSFLSETLNSEEQTFEKTIVSGKNEFLDHRDIRMIEREIVSVRLNGYPTSNPFGKQARRAEVTVYMSVVPEEMIRTIQTSIQKHLHSEHITFHTFPLASFGGMQVVFPHEHTYVFVDVTGESTSLSFVKGGSIVGSEMIPLGRNFLIRGVMNEMKIAEDAALSSISMLKDDVLSASTGTSLASVIQKTEAAWKDGCLKVIREKGEVLGHIQNYFLIADSDVETFFSSMLKTLALPSGGFPTVRTITEEVFGDKILTEKHIRKDRFLSLEALSVGKFHKPLA